MIPVGERVSGYSVRTPVVVIRPIMSESISVNQSAPSDPVVMSVAHASP